MKRSLRVTLLLWLVLCLSAWNGLRFWTALSWMNVLREFSARPDPTVTAASGAIWAVTGLILAWGIWQNKAWARKLLIVAAAGYTVWYWIGRLIWHEPRPNWPFAIAVNLFLLIFIFNATKPSKREAYE